ncbi:MAG: hypothetical protein H7145_22295, partial [Akkermansiaceae bacterium]|nr:hypothetical protein [Armatimonadota bacterium]
PTLTPEQRQTLEGGGRLPTALLTPKQRAQIERLALNGYTAPLDSPSKDALLILKAADKVAVVKKLSEGEEVFGYNFHEVAYDRTVFRPIRGINRKGQFNADSNTPRSGDDAPAPDRKGVTWEGKDTLDTVVAALQTPSGNTRVMKVDPALAAKPVTVVGAEFTPPGIVLTALANVYGLRVAEEKDGSLLLTRPRIRFAANITDLRESVARLIPEPLLRSLRVESPASEASQNPPGNGRDVAPTASRMMGGASGSDKSVRLVQKAAWRLKGMYDIQKNEADKTGEGQRSSFPEISLSRLPAEGRAAFAVTVLQDFLSQLFFFSDRPTPATITDFETGFLTGGMHEEQGDQHFSLMLNVETETPGAKTTNATGFSGIWYAEVKNK